MSKESNPKLPDLAYVRELAKVFQDHELDELEIETGETRMLLRRGEIPVAAPAAVAPLPVAAAPTPLHAPVGAAVAAETASQEDSFLTSPFVGTFYRSARPDAPSFVEVGASVSQGDTVCIVEAMKLFNEIESDFDCVIEEALVENGQPVEYGAKLFRVRKL